MCIVAILLMTRFIDPVFAMLTHIMLGLLQTVGVQVAMPELQPDAFPFWDSTMLVLSIAAMVLMTRKYVENWLLWVLIDIISVVIYAVQGVYAMSLEYVLLTAIRDYGIVQLGPERKTQRLYAACRQRLLINAFQAV